jgi:hypothetical protein
MLAPKICPPASLRDLIRRLMQAGCYQQGVAGMAGPRGPKTFRELVRIMPDNRKRSAQLPNMDDNDRLPHQIGRSLCNQLGLDAADFGY